MAGVEKEPAQGCTHERCLGRRADALRVMRGECVGRMVDEDSLGEGRQAALGVSLGGERGPQAMHEGCAACMVHACRRDS